jgi:hypothetical protein
MNWSHAVISARYQDVSRILHRFARIFIFCGLAISGVWGAWAWWLDQSDPLFRVLSISQAPVKASVVSFPPPSATAATYRQAVIRERVAAEPFHVEQRAEPQLTAPAIVPESTQPLHQMPRYAQLPHLVPPRVEPPPRSRAAEVSRPHREEPYQRSGADQHREMCQLCDDSYCRELYCTAAEIEAAKPIYSWCSPERDECWR